ncbi:MAG: HAD family hydrolase [Clostridia bacterium]|nr:HAD family hydrolase [Clostridia bacterium]
MEITGCLPSGRPRPKAFLFDFDGTISTLRHGWEGIMEPLMLEMICGSTPPGEALKREVGEYIDSSTGIQTIHQMQWLAQAVKRHGLNPGASEDPWWYKAEYNRRLMIPVERRRQSILSGEVPRSRFLVRGSAEFLAAIKRSGAAIYVASGTDQQDVMREARALGVEGCFTEIAGALPGSMDCSKEAVLRRLMEVNFLRGPEIAVFGDGRVEIELGREAGAVTVGVASDEEKLCGVNPVKRKKLLGAGAHAIIGDFTQAQEIFSWLGLQDIRL